ncbi:hypothetical protein [Agrobacterium cavarae]|uniref:hypothetical protein n=1 Tax=Agrobacterium cavarae TaxID=2528239 RepID=UPI0028A00E89|nr:hypothetical protein [Agrobacterium cavarae]
MATDDEIKSAAKAEMFKRLAAAELKRRQAASHPSFEEGQKLIEQEEAQGRWGETGALLASTLDGVPIAGPYLLDAGQKGAAGLASTMNGKSYEDNLAEAKRKTALVQEQNPIASTVGTVAGGVGGTLPMIAAAPTAFGAGGGSVLLRTGASVLSGGVIGGADAGVRSGGDPTKIIEGTALGAGMGLVAPAAAKVIGRGAKSLIDASRNWRAARAAGIKPEALSHLNRAVMDDGLDAAAVQTRLADMGPDAIMADLGPNLQKQAGALAASPGRAQEIVRTALNDRQAGANARIGSAIDENLGPRSIVPSEVEAGIRANQEALGPQYGEVFQHARAVDTAPIAHELESQIVNLRGEGQRAAQRVRGMLDINGSAGNLDPNPGTLFQTRQAIDGYMATETNPQAIRVYTMARQQIDDMLANAVPRLKEVDANFAELARQREALQRGQTVLASGKEAPRPSELINEVEQGVQPQGLQIGPSAVPLRLSQGARAEVERIVGTKANNVVELNKMIAGEGRWNRDRLATLFGQEKADRLIKVVENERTFADTANTVTRNSETAARQAAQAELGVVEAGGFGPAEAFKAGGIRGAARSVAYDQASKLAKAFLPKSGEQARADLATALVSADRNKIVEALRGVGERPVPRLLDPVARALLIGGGTAGAR